jgi:hypothetical protein
MGAFRRAVCAGHAVGAGERASRNAPLAGFRLAVAPGSDHVPARQGVASRRWVMSTTTHVSPVSGVPARLADPAKVSVSVAGVSRRLPRPDWSR